MTNPTRTLVALMLLAAGCARAHAQGAPRPSLRRDAEVPFDAPEQRRDASILDMGAVLGRPDGALPDVSAPDRRFDAGRDAQGPDAGPRQPGLPPRDASAIDAREPLRARADAEAQEHDDGAPRDARPVLALPPPPPQGPPHEILGGPDRGGGPPIHTDDSGVAPLRR